MSIYHFGFCIFVSYCTNNTNLNIDVDMSYTILLITIPQYSQSCIFQTMHAYIYIIFIMFTYHLIYSFKNSF